jgi:PAS domain-containing protein
MTDIADGQAYERLRATIGVMEDRFGLFDATIASLTMMPSWTRHTEVWATTSLGAVRRDRAGFAITTCQSTIWLRSRGLISSAWNNIESARCAVRGAVAGGRCMRTSDRRTSDGGYVGIWSDVSKIKLAEQRLLTAIEAMDSAFALFDSNDRLVAANDRFVGREVERHLGGLRGRSFEEIIRAFVEIGPSVKGRRSTASNGSAPRRPPPERGRRAVRQQLGDGRWERVSERCTEDGGYVGVWTDITAVKVAEQRLPAAISSMADGFALFDAEDRSFTTIRACRRQSGQAFHGAARPYLRGDHPGVRLQRRHAVAALLDREAWIKRRVEMHRSPADEPFEQQTTNGKWCRVFERRTADGGYLGIWTDISALKDAEARVRDAIESINEGFALLDSDMRFVIVNNNFVSMYPVSGKLAVPGARLEDMLRYGAGHGEYPGIETPAQVEAFVALWMERFTSGDRYLGEGEMPDGSWYLVSHHPTATGGHVSIRADITL